MAKSSKPIQNFVVGDSKTKWKGLNTIVKDNRFLDPGESYDQVNWITGRDQDHIELRRGSVILGKTKRNIAGTEVMGLGIGIKNDGTQVPFFKFAQKILYYNSTLDDTVEIGSNILPVAATTDDFNFMPYQNLAGSFIYGTSKNSSIYKFSVANLGSYADLSISTTIGNPTISIAGPAVITITNTLKAGNTVMFTTTGTLPTGISANTVYFVLPTSLSTSSFEISATLNGSAITTTGTQSGTHTLIKIAGATDFHFNFAKINRGYMFGMNRKGRAPNSFDTTGLYLSTPDSIANNAAVQNFSVGTGDGTTKTFTGTISLVATNTAYFISITDNNEVFTDDKNGNLIGSLGGIGTINYVTGAYSVTFNTAPTNTQPIMGTYYQEDSTVGGVADFTGQGSDTLRQDDGGGIAQAVWPFNGVEYCFHQLRSWLLTIDVSTTPVGLDNEPYYEQIGVPSTRAVYPTGDGIVFLNNAIPSNPKVSILEIPPGSTVITIVPVSLSDSLDLSSFGIDQCVIFRWNDWDFVSLKGVTNGMVNSYNGVTFMRNIVSGIWNQLGNFFINCGTDYDGTLIAGSSISPNVLELLTGFSDSNSLIPNHHYQAFTDLGIQGLKTTGYLNMSGLIQNGQSLEVYISLDNGAYVKVFTISGTGPYVSTSQIIAVGTQGVGVGVVGGGFDGDPAYASRYELDIPLNPFMSRFEYISWGIKATSAGFVSVERAEFKDIRIKRQRILSYEDPEISTTS